MRLRVLALGIIVTTVFLAPAALPEPARAMHPCSTSIVGDLWGEGEVDSADAMAVLVHVAQTGYDHWCAPLDVDCDGIVTAVDALKILRYVADMPYQQAEPCPDIGSQLH